MPSNRAAWLVGSGIAPLEVKEAPYTPPRANEIVVKNAAVAINPIDPLVQNVGGVMFSWIKYPFVLGNDVAGEVVEVGKGVTTYKVGDRVVGLAVATDKRSNRAAEGAFQEYTVLRTNLTSHIPGFMSYTDACVLPLGLSTAACGLFMKDFLALQSPSPISPPKPNGQTLLIWGGSTSVGTNAIQLAIAAGYEVITTASPKNFNYVKDLGATHVFDYRSKTVVKDIIAVLANKQSAGALAIGDGSLDACIEIIAASKGKKFVAQATVTFSGGEPKNATDMMMKLPGFLFGNFVTWLKCKFKGVKSNFIFGSDLMANEVGSIIFEEYLPGALATGIHKALPEPQVAGHGLEAIQKSFDVWRSGVSAKKVVVTL